MRFPRFPRLVSRTLFRIAKSIPAVQNSGPDVYRDMAARMQMTSYLEMMARTPGKSTVDAMKLHSYQERAQRQIKKNEILGMPYGYHP